MSRGLQVDLGPFKHTIDDGLELRKAAFECMHTLLDGCFDQLELSTYFPCLLEGLRDDHDIKLICHLLLCKLAAACSGSETIVAFLDSLADPLRATICATLKDSAVKQQIDRQEELILSGLRAARALERMPEAQRSAKFGDFVRHTLRTGRLADRYATVCAEEEKSAETKS